MSKWKEYKLFPNPDKLPNKPCVYAIYFGNDLVYVGQSNSLSNRFSGHAFRFGYAKNIHTPWQDLPMSTTIRIKAKFSEKLGDWAMWEIRLIRRLKPIHNTHHRNKRKEVCYEN
jgi:excinuclease UvrABC nuclease subunit